MDFDSHLMIHQYRNVVYLNNAATTFMARGEYQQAMLSLKDALFLLETIVRPVASSLLKSSPTKDIDFSKERKGYVFTYEHSIHIGHAT